MKLLALIISTLLATALLMGSAIVIATTADGDLGVLEVLPLAASSVFIFGPLMLGSLTAYFEAGLSDASRSAFRRRLVIIIGLEVLAAVAIVAYAFLRPTAAWIPLLFIGVGVVLTAVAPAVGGAVRRLDARRRSAAPAWQSITSEEIGRRVRTVAVTFVVALVVAIGAAAVVFAMVDEGRGSFWQLLPITASLAFLAAGMACILVSLGWNRRLREVLGHDLGNVRLFAKVVLGRTGWELDQAQRVGAARYAATVPAILGFQLAYITLLYTGLALQQVNTLLSGHAAQWVPWLLGAMVVVLFVFFPLFLRRIRRAQHYAREHAGLLRDESVTA